MLTTQMLQNKQATVVVMGLGYVGLPLAVAFAQEGFKVIGLDADIAKIEHLRSGQNYIRDVNDAVVKSCVSNGYLRPEYDPSCLREADVVIICVPTPLSKTKDPDISYIVAASQSIAEYVSKFCLVVLESTTYPGTTEEVILPILQGEGAGSAQKTLGKDFALAFSPERVDPGNPTFQTRNIPKIVGGIDAQSRELATALYGTIVSRVVPVSSPRVAETAKLLENTFRTVNIGLINEMAMMCRQMNIDIWEVIDAAATKPFGFMPFYPGPGLGGHCLPIDPLYLAWKARLHNFEARFISLAAEVNRAMPAFVVQRVSDVLNDAALAIKNAHILILGVAYKNDIDDVRESPALDVIELLEHKGAKVSYCDPYVSSLKVLGHEYHAVSLNESVLQKADCVVIVTAHKTVDYAMVVRNAKRIVDTRHATAKVAGDKKHVHEL